MYKICFILVLVACFAVISEAQLTFTSSWGGGKRSGNMGPLANAGCRNEEAVFAIYRMIQVRIMVIYLPIWLSISHTPM